VNNHQASRYELKYLVTEAQALAIRQHVLAYLTPDDNTEMNSIGYRVQSLYLDSRKLTCYTQTMQGFKNRFKLRIRFYDDKPDSPVFLEIKRRVTNVIQKKRAMVDRQSGEAILRGERPNPSMLLKDNATERDALQSFCQLKDEVGAVGKVFVDYYREAFQCGGANHYRVTFDRNVCGSTYEPGNGLRVPERSKMAKIPGVVLEMKYVEKPAPWMIDIARRFHIERTSVPKYVECVDVVKQSSSMLMEM